MTTQYGTSVWFTGPQQVELRHAPISEINSDEILVRALYSAISHGTERLAYRGEIDPDLPLDLPTFQGSFSFPLKYGYASVGVVEAVAHESSGLKVGDRVFALHPHQDRFVVPASLVTLLPDELEPSLGVYTAQIETALNVILDAAPRSRETVVVFGQGVVGLLITRLLARLDLENIVAVDGIAARRELARGMGATQAISPDEARELTRSITAGRGADCVIEVSGAPAALNAAIECAAIEAEIIVASWYGNKPVALQLGTAFHRRRLHLRSSQVGMISPSLSPRWDRDRRTATVRELLPQLQLGSLSHCIVPFRKAARAYELIDSMPDEIVQVILSYDTETR